MYSWHCLHEAFVWWMWTLFRMSIVAKLWGTAGTAGTVPRYTPRDHATPPLRLRPFSVKLQIMEMNETEAGLQPEP